MVAEGRALAAGDEVLAVVDTVLVVGGKELVADDSRRVAVELAAGAGHRLAQVLLDQGAQAFSRV